MWIESKYLSLLLLPPFPIRHMILYNLCCLCRTMLPTDRFNKITFWIYSPPHTSSVNNVKREDGRKGGEKKKSMTNPSSRNKYYDRLDNPAQAWRPPVCWSIPDKLCTLVLSAPTFLWGRRWKDGIPQGRILGLRGCPGLDRKLWIWEEEQVDQGWKKMRMMVERRRWLADWQNRSWRTFCPAPRGRCRDSAWSRSRPGSEWWSQWLIRSISYPSIILYFPRRRKTPKTHQRESPFHILIRKRPPIMIQQLKCSPNLGSPNPLRRLRHTLPLQPLLLMSKIKYHPRARGEKKHCGAQREGLYTYIYFSQSKLVMQEDWEE